MRSGRTNLDFVKLETVQAAWNGLLAYTAPQVFSTQDQLPQVRVDTNVNITVYPTNSAASGSDLRILEGNTRGEASRETGSVIMSSKIGRTNIMDEKDICIRIARLSSEAEARPVASKGETL